MTRLIKKTADNYTNVSNKLVRDSRLTWKARGIFVYLWSQADNWNFYVGEIAEHAKDGKDSLTAGLKELEEYGYLERKYGLNNQGKIRGMDWVLSDKPFEGKIPQNPANNADFTSEGNSLQGKNPQRENPPLSINNNKNYQEQEISKEENKHSAPANAGLSELQKDFDQLWKQYPNKKGKAQAFNHYKAWRKKATTNTNDYLIEKLNVYKKYIEQNQSWYHAMSGSTWFNGRFEDEYQIATDNNTQQPTTREEWFGD